MSQTLHSMNICCVEGTFFGNTYACKIHCPATDEGKFDEPIEDRQSFSGMPEKFCLSSKGFEDRQSFSGMPDVCCLNGSFMGGQYFCKDHPADDDSLRENEDDLDELKALLASLKVAESEDLER